MLRSQHLLISFQCSSIHLLCLLILSLTSKHQCQIAETDQCLWMLRSQHLLVSFQCSSVHLLCLLILSPISNVKSPVDFFCYTVSRKAPNEGPLNKLNILSEEDWQVLAKLYKILQPFFDLTLYLQIRLNEATTAHFGRHYQQWNSFSRI